MRKKLIIDENGKPKLLKYFSKDERFAIKKNNIRFCATQHRNDFQAIKEYEVKARHKAYDKAYYQRPEVKAYYKAYYQRHKKILKGPKS